MTLQACPPASAHFLVLLVLAATASSFTDAHHAGGNGGAASWPHEREALLSFKQGITSDPRGILASWRGGEDEQDCCRWRGIQCSNLTGRVLKLHLQESHISYDDSGQRNDDGGLVGEISHSLLSLDHLEYLDLSMNHLQGPTGRIPAFLGSFKNLRYLNLSGIPFSGRVPPQLGNLSRLHYLDLSNSQGMYSTDLSWLTHLPMLRHLDMESVNLSTIVDWPHVVNTIPSLRVLNLDGCLLTSANQLLPHLNLTNLEELVLFWNNFGQPLVSCWFWDVTSLKNLDLGATNLYGPLPDTVGNLAFLQILDLSVNHDMDLNNLRKLCSLRILYLTSFSYPFGNISTLIDMLPRNRLQELYLGSNELTGFLPKRIEHFTDLVVLDLSLNNITGPLPGFIGHFKSLRIFDLSSNHLSGHVPLEIGMLTSLSKLDLSNNNLDGRVPFEISMLTNLSKLDLCDNNLDGLITEEHLGGLRRLEYICLSRNKLKIVLDSNWLAPFRLKEAYFQSCHMGPLFPEWLKCQVDILWLDISQTGIVDSLPYWFCYTFSNTIALNISNNEVRGVLPTNMQIMSLERLYLSSNQLTGPIQFPRNLTHLDISNNALSGPLPSIIGAPNLQYLILPSNYINGHIPGSICELRNLEVIHLANNLFEGKFPQCVGTRNITALLLSNNRLSGKFPSTIQSWPHIAFLDLSKNKYSGRLPLWIGDLTGLQFLRLSYNMFSLDIPSNVTKLKNLYHLNLAGNRFTGDVPWHLSDLKSMVGKYIGNDYQGKYILVDADGYNLSVVTKHQELYYRRAITDMVSFDLSQNFLTGVVPEALASLAALINLNLSRNYLSGKIPDRIGALRSLESLRPFTK